MLNSLVHSPTGYDTLDQKDIELSWIMNSSMNFLSVCCQGMSLDYFKEQEQRSGFILFYFLVQFGAENLTMELVE